MSSFTEVGPIAAVLLLPAKDAGKPPLMALHGISRNVDQMVAELSIAAIQHGRQVILPYFAECDWPVFQRITRRHRPDRALLALIETLRSMQVLGNAAFDLFGFSGGAQLAHRFAMLYPQMVRRLHMGASGWYTLPDNGQPYPMGIGCSDKGTYHWGRRMASGLDSYLRRQITVYVGSEDTVVDSALRSNQALNDIQGENRVQRARHYVETLRRLQADCAVEVSAELVVFDGCGHDFMQCSRRGGLSARVCN